MNIRLLVSFYQNVTAPRLQRGIEFCCSRSNASDPEDEETTMNQCLDTDNLHRRLNKIAGQVKAIDRMIDEDVPCEDILSQINAAKSALQGCGKVILEGHIKSCVREGIATGDADKAVEDFSTAVDRFSNMS